MKRVAVVALINCASAACAPTQLRTDTNDDVRKTITSLLNEMAANTSARDVKGNLHLIPQTPYVVYVSDGAPITGEEYARELGQSYASRSAMAFKWDKIEITPIGRTAAAVTAWATVTLTPIDGKPTTGRYIYTMVFAKDPAGWKRVLAQKAELKE